MSAVGDIIRNSRKIVVNIGSQTLSDDHGAVNEAAMHNIVEQLHELMNMGKILSFPPARVFAV